MVINNITVLILCHDNVNSIKRTLDSVKAFENVFLIDSGSTDGTLEIGRNYSNVIIHTNPFKSFSDQRNFALKQTKTEWALFLDSDETVSENLSKHLETASLTTSANIIGLFRTEYLDHKEIKYGIGKSDYQLRLMRALKVSYQGTVHETPVDSENLPIERLSEDLRLHHWPARDFDSIVYRLHRYSKLTADAKKANKNVSALQIFINMNYQALRLIWISRKDGWRGVLSAWMEAIFRTIVYLYIYEDNRLKAEQSKESSN